MSAARSLAHIPCPPLENGDRLSRVEFHRRYEAMPTLKKADLIEGVVFLGSPVSDDHSVADNMLSTWLGNYSATHPGAQAGGNGTVILDADNEFQPDVVLRRTTGGSSHIEGKYVAGPPELVVEIAASSVSRDLHAKKNVYRRSGVQEYIVWRILDGELDWFELRDGEYHQLPPDERGVIHSNVFPGLRLAVPQLLAGDLAAVLAEQQRA